MGLVMDLLPQHHELRFEASKAIGSGGPGWSWGRPGIWRQFIFPWFLGIWLPITEGRKLASLLFVLWDHPSAKLLFPSNSHFPVNSSGWPGLGPYKRGCPGDNSAWDGRWPPALGPFLQAPASGSPPASPLDSGMTGQGNENKESKESAYLEEE